MIPVPTIAGVVKEGQFTYESLKRLADRAVDGEITLGVTAPLVASGTLGSGVTLSLPIPAQRVVFGTGTSISSDANLTWDSSTATLGVNGRMLVADGSSGAPSIARAAVPGTGWWFGGSATLFTNPSGTPFSIITTNAYLQWGGLLRWGNTEAATGVISLGRYADGVLQVGDGGANALGTLFSRNAINVYNVKAYGATGDGTTDDRAAVLTAKGLAEAVNGEVFFPAGSYRISSAITVTPPVSIVGEGRSSSRILGPLNDDTFIFNYTGSTTLPLVKVKDLGFDVYGGSEGTSGAFLKGSTGTNELTFHISGCQFDSGFASIYLDKQELSIIKDNLFLSNSWHAGYDIYIDHSTNADGGDTLIEGNTFISVGRSSIHHLRGGGVRIIGNKFGGAPESHYYQQMPNGSSSGALIIANNSFEGLPRVSHVSIVPDGGWYTTDIHNNEFAIYPIWGSQELGLTGKTAGTATGLAASTTYWFKVNKDGGGLIEKSITTAADTTWGAVLVLINAQMTGGLAGVYWEILQGDIRCESPTFSGSSSIALSAGTTGTDLFGALTGFTTFDPATKDTCPYSIYIAPSGTGTVVDGIISSNTFVQGTNAIYFDPPGFNTDVWHIASNNFYYQSASCIRFPSAVGYVRDIEIGDNLVSPNGASSYIVGDMTYVYKYWNPLTNTFTAKSVVVPTPAAAENRGLWVILGKAVGVNLNAVAATTIFTTPASGFSRCVVNQVVMTNCSGTGTTASISFGSSGTPTDWVASTVFNGATPNKRCSINAANGANNATYGTGVAFVANVTIPQGSACTCDFTVWGYYE